MNGVCPEGYEPPTEHPTLSLVVFIQCFLRFDLPLINRPRVPSTVMLSF